MLSPRGSRESLSSRLSHKGQGSLIVLLLILLVSSAFLVGMAAGPRFCAPLSWGWRPSGSPRHLVSRGWSLGLTALLLDVGRAGCGPGRYLAGASSEARLRSHPVSWESARLLWTRKPDDLS